MATGGWFGLSERHTVGERALEPVGKHGDASCADDAREPVAGSGTGTPASIIWTSIRLSFSPYCPNAPRF